MLGALVGPSKAASFNIALKLLSAVRLKQAAFLTPLLAHSLGTQDFSNYEGKKGYNLSSCFMTWMCTVDLHKPQGHKGKQKK